MQPGLSLTMTRNPTEIRAARRLRHAVFVEELGAAAGADEELEGDAFDEGSDHLLLRDTARTEAGVVATARLRDGTGWTGRSFDLSALTERDLRIVEVGRTCLHRDYRGGAAALVLLGGLLDAIRARGAEAAIGTASFPGTDPAPHLPALRAVRRAALAPSPWRATARGPGTVDVAGDAPRAAMIGVPALIKTYLRAGAWVGDGAHVDRGFGTVDICVILDLSRCRVPSRRPA